MSFGRREGGPPPPLADPVIERLKERAANRRDMVRLRRLKKAELIYDDGKHVAGCTLRDESATGARVKLGAWFACPKDVTLRLSDGTTYESYVVWARELELGLRFKSADQNESLLTEVPDSKPMQINQVISALKGASLETVFGAIKERSCFSDADVAKATEKFGDAYYDLLGALREAHDSELEEQ